MSGVHKLAWFGCLFDGDNTHLGVLDWSSSQNIRQESCDSSIGTRARIMVRPSSFSRSGSRSNNTRSDKSPWRYALDLPVVFQRILFAAAKLTTHNASISSRTPLPHKRLLYSGRTTWPLSLSLLKCAARSTSFRRVGNTTGPSSSSTNFSHFVHSSVRLMSNPFADVLALSLSLSHPLSFYLSFLFVLEVFRRFPFFSVLDEYCFSATGIR